MTNGDKRKNPGTVVIPGVLSKYKGLSALAELRSATGAFETVLFALFHSGVSGKETGLLESGAEILVVLQQGAGKAVADGAGLAGHAAARYAADHVELLGGLGEGERLTDDEFQRFKTEIIVDLSVVDDDLTGAGIHAHTRDGFLSSAGAVKIRITFVHNSTASLSQNSLATGF